MKNIISWSGGKDSTASVILAHEHNIKIDHIIFCEVMFDKKTTGEMPEKMEFVKNKAKPLFEEWGYQVDILHYPKTYIDIFFQIRTKRSKWSGKRIGFPMAGKCYMNDAKREPIKKFYREIGEEYTDYVGIAIDEPERLVKMKQRNAAKGLNQVSLLEKYGYTEEMAMQKCREYDLVSPTYKYSKRDGCWFCPNARKDELRHLRKCHPDLWNKLIELEKEENLAGEIWNTRNGISMRDNERFFAQEEQQMTIFDFIKGAVDGHQERLKQCRKEKRMTQEQVAERAGLTAASVSRWENGEREPTFRDVEKVAAALGVAMEELTRESEPGTGFRKIIEGKVYDTGKARILFEFRRKYQDPLNPLFFGKNMVHNVWEDAQFLKTVRGAYLFYCPARKDLQVVTEREVADTIRKLDADAYIRIFGGVEEG